MRQTTAPMTTPSPQIRGGSKKVADRSAAALFTAMALDMSWRLVLVVFVPVVVGAELDKYLKAPYALVAGLAVAVLGTIWVLWRTMQAANRLPVPKLTEAQKKAIRKQYEEDDNDR